MVLYPFYMDHELPLYPFGHPDCRFCKKHQYDRPFPDPLFYGYRVYYGRPHCPIGCTDFLYDVEIEPPGRIVYEYGLWHYRPKRSTDRVYRVSYLYPGGSGGSPHPYIEGPYLPGDRRPYIEGDSTDRCPVCHGSGSCPACHGSGFRERYSTDGCHVCQGSGSSRNQRERDSTDGCHVCHGSGSSRSQRERDSTDCGHGYGSGSCGHGYGSGSGSGSSQNQQERDSTDRGRGSGHQDRMRPPSPQHRKEDSKQHEKHQRDSTHRGQGSGHQDPSPHHHKEDSKQHETHHRGQGSGHQDPSPHHHKEDSKQHEKHHRGQGSGHQDPSPHHHKEDSKQHDHDQDRKPHKQEQAYREQQMPYNPHRQEPSAPPLRPEHEEDIPQCQKPKPNVQPCPLFVGRERPIDRQQRMFKEAMRRGEYNGFEFSNPGRALKDVESYRPNSEVLRYLESHSSNVYFNVWITKSLMSMVKNGIRTWAPKTPPIKKAVVDFLSPDIAKDLHVAHFRTAITAESIARLLEFAGVEVVRRNSLGAWGLKFGRLLMYLTSEYPDLEEVNLCKLQVQDVYKAATAATAKYDGDISFLGYSVEFHQAWPLVYQFCYEQFRKTFESLEIFIEKQEELLHSYILAVVYHLMDKKLMKLNDKNKPLLIEEDDSCRDLHSEMSECFNNVITDMTALWYRLNVEKAQWIIYSTTPEHHDHLDTVSKVAKRSGWIQHDSSYNSDEYPKVSQVSVGPVSRSHSCMAEAVKLVDIIDAAKTAWQTYVHECGKDRGFMDKNWLQENASTLAHGAAKYVYLKNNECRNEKSALVEMLKDMKSNLYLLDHGSLNYMRVHDKEVEAENIELADDLELELGSHLMMFAEAVETACTSLKPSLLCNYLHQLIELFIRLSADYKVRAVIEHVKKSFVRRRDLLCEAATSVMRQCFDLLGIPNPMELRLGNYC